MYGGKHGVHSGNNVQMCIQQVIRFFAFPGGGIKKFAAVFSFLNGAQEAVTGERIPLPQGGIVYRRDIGGNGAATDQVFQKSNVFFHLSCPFKKVASKVSATFRSRRKSGSG
jgi:hypothetical protein